MRNRQKRKAEEKENHFPERPKLLHGVFRRGMTKNGAGNWPEKKWFAAHALQTKGESSMRQVAKQRREPEG